MKVTLESTTKMVTVSGVTARVWEGTTERGVRCFAFIIRIGVPVEADHSEFEAELEEQRPPSPDLGGAIPSRLIL